MALLHPLAAELKQVLARDPDLPPALHLRNRETPKPLQPKRKKR